MPRMLTKARMSAAPAALALALASTCTGERVEPRANEFRGESTMSLSTATTEKPRPAEIAKEFFTLLSGNDLKMMGLMVDLAEPGSPAHAYAVHQIARRRAGGVPESSIAEVRDGDIKSCADVVGTDGTPQEFCNVFSDFTFNAKSGKLESFSGDGQPIDSRIKSGDPAGATDQGVTVRLVTVLKGAEGWLVLNLEVENGSTTPLAVADYDSEYIGPDGQQFFPAINFVTNLPKEIQPGATAPSMVLFDTRDLGGTYTFVGFANDSLTEIRIDVAVPR
jgi:hypothetical protein